MARVDICLAFDPWRKTFSLSLLIMMLPVDLLWVYLPLEKGWLSYQIEAVPFYPSFIYCFDFESVGFPPDPGTEPGYPALQCTDALPFELPGKPEMVFRIHEIII